MTVSTPLCCLLEMGVHSVNMLIMETFRRGVLHVIVDASERPDDGEGRGELVVREQVVDCVIRLEVSCDDSGITMGSLLFSLLWLLFPSDMVIDIRRPPDCVWVSYVMVVVYSSRLETPSGETL